MVESSCATARDKPNHGRACFMSPERGGALNVKRWMRMKALQKRRVQIWEECTLTCDDTRAVRQGQRVF